MDCINQCSLCFLLPPSNNKQSNTQCAIRAASNGHVNCLEHVFDVGCDMIESICNAAANKGHLNCLKCARTHECPWSSATYDILISGGYYDCIKYACDYGCPTISKVPPKSEYTSQNELLLNNLIKFYEDDEMLKTMLSIISGELMSLRIVDWFSTNYAKEFYTIYSFVNKNNQNVRFKVYNDYKLRLKSYTKKRFDPFCRWDRIRIPYKDNTCIETTIGQLNFFKWALENKVIDYIIANYEAINADMVSRKRITSKNKEICGNNRTRKKREELSTSAVKSIKRERVAGVLQFH